MPRVRKVIESEILRGSGTENDPSRRVYQLHALNGELLAEKDEWVDTKFHDYIDAAVQYRHFASRTKALVQSLSASTVGDDISISNTMWMLIKAGAEQVYGHQDSSKVSSELLESAEKAS